jgi:ribose 1,5-bisphosphate isomerase
MSLDKGVEKIRSVKVQGATSVAFYALKLFVDYAGTLKSRKDLVKLRKAKQLLAGARPNEPMLRNVLELFYNSIPRNKDVKEIRRRLVSQQKLFLEQFRKDFETIAENGAKLVKPGDIVFTHCHSSTVMQILKRAAKNKRFRVVCTETRPLFQGRKTAKELVKSGIKTKMVVDSHMLSEIKECDKVFLGADVLSSKGFMNKVGSYNAAYAAKHFRKPLYVCAHTLKYTPKVSGIERRDAKEVWPNPPGGLEIENYAFELVPWVFVSRVVSERGVKKYGDLL